ncbi:hypothetical protein ACFPM7_00815 [Actinokineospora guangxiensis]|uniref:Uncharacterized protein n=1 Tax=Actinokineospora guangxiensis TaxID=1490288 RepID=A0ABW0EDV3_9PSEU
MRRRVRTIAAGLALVLGGASAGLVAGATQAAAAEPIVVGSCAASIQGAPGTPISLAPSAVLGPVLSIVRAVPLLGPGLAGGVEDALSTMGNIPLGVIPNADTTIGGGTIAAAAVPRIKSAISKVPLIGPALAGIVTQVQGALTTGCGIVVDVVNAVAEPVQEGGETVGKVVEGTVGRVLPGGSAPGPGPGPGQPNPPGGGNPGGGSPNQPGGGNPGGGGGGVPGVSNPILGGGAGIGTPPLYDGLGRAPRDYYGGIPVFSPGLFSPSPAVRYGGAVPGYTPEFGILGGESGGDGVQAAGHAEAIGGPVGNRIALPVLLAVLILSGVTAALVRTWVLRRTAA